MQEIDFKKLLCVYKALVFDISKEVFDSKGYPIIHEKDPVNEYELCNKKYIDSMVAELKKGTSKALTYNDVESIVDTNIKENSVSERELMGKFFNNIKESMKVLEDGVNKVFTISTEKNDTTSKNCADGVEKINKLCSDLEKEISALKEKIKKNDINKVKEDLEITKVKLDNLKVSILPIDSIPTLISDQKKQGLDIDNLKRNLVVPSGYVEEVLQLTVDFGKGSILKVVKDRIPLIGMVKDFYRRIFIEKIGFQMSEYDANGNLIVSSKKTLKKPFEITFTDFNKNKQQIVFDANTCVRNYLNYFVDFDVFDNITILTKDINQCFGNADDLKMNIKEKNNNTFVPIIIKDPNVKRIDILMKFLLKLTY